MKIHVPLFSIRAFAIVGMGFIFTTLNVFAAAPAVVWSGASGTDTNWSNGNNWFGNVQPAASADVKFFDAGANGTANTPNNLVDGSFAGSIGSLQYGNTNGFHTTVIASSQTLNITGVNGLTVGTLTANGNTQIVTATITGAGTLNVSNTAANLLVEQGLASNGNGTQRATLDMSGLGTFAATVSRVAVATTTLGGANNAQNTTGTLKLGQTNLITASFAGSPITSNPATPTNSIDIGSDNGNAGGVNFFYLGQTNAFFIDSIGVGMDKATATMLFNPAFTGPSAYFRGTGGANSRIRFWTVGDMSSSGTSSGFCTATNDFTGGTVDALVDTMSLGRDRQGGNTGASVTKGTLTFTSGTIDVNNLFAGNQQFTAAANSNPMAGVVNVNGATATLVVNSSLVLARTNVASTAAAATTGNLNIFNGTVRANSITRGANGSTIAMTNALLVITNTVGTPALPITTFGITNSTLNLFVASTPATNFCTTTLTTGGAGNTINVLSVPVFGASSYPKQIPLISYSTLAGVGYNFVLGSVPSSAPGAFLSNNVANKTIDLYLPSNPAPVITSEPTSYSGSPGDNVTTSFAVTIAAGSVQPLSYQWFYYTNGGLTNLLVDGNGPSGTSTISGSTNANLQMLNATNGDSGNYFVVITNLYGSATSSVSILTINAGGFPIISPVPQNQTVVQGNNATFVSGVSANPAATIVWQTFGTNIPGATSSTLVVTNVQYPANDQESYSIIASNSFGSVTNTATLTVIVPPTITVQPVSLVVTNTQSASFSITVTGAVPAEVYQWKKNGVPISPAVNSTATNATFTIASASPSDINTYSVTVTNLAGASNSVSVSLTVNSTMAATALSPGNNAAGICYDTPLYITFGATPALRNAGTIKIYNITNRTTPVDTINLAANSGTGNQAIQPHSLFAGDAQIINYYPVIITGSTAAIYPHGGVMTSNQTYYVTIDDGVFADTSGAYFAGITATNAWQFTTKPTGPATPTNMVVAIDGSGDFVTVQGAVDSVLPGNNNFTVINIRNGNYVEIVDISGKNNITFRGQSRTGTVVGYANNNNNNPSTASRAAFKVNSADIKLENLTLTNATPQNGSQAETLLVFGAGLRCIANNCDIVSRQDTVLINNSTSQCFFNNCKVVGNFDYIWGQGVAYFNNCVIHTIPGASQYNLTAARTLTSGALSAATPWVNPNGTTFSAYGFSFVGCTLEADAGVTTVTMAGSNGTAGGLDSWVNCLINTNFYVNPLATLPPSSYVLWQYNNTFTNGVTPVTFTNLQTIGVTNNDPRLLAATNITTWFSGWTPQMLPNIISQPGNQSVSAGQSASFTVSATGFPNPTYQWLLNSSPISGATSTNYTIPSAVRANAGGYSVIVSNSSGSITSSVATLTYTGNVAPVAGSTFTMNVVLEAPSTVQIVGGKYSPTDADGDALTITITGAPTNGIATTDGTNITYTATNAAATNDSFNYTVSDGFGGSDSQNVSVVIDNSQSGQTGHNSLNAQLVGGQAVLSFAGIPNYNYALDETHDLTVPITWTPVVTNTASANGNLIFTNTPSGGNDFYRTRSVP